MNGSDSGEKAFLGVIVLDTRFPRPPGDIGCPQTWTRAGIPARLRVVPGASARRVVQQQDPALLGPFIDAARSLADDGARLISTSCGFLAGWQAELQAVVPVPVITSSLLQCADLPAPGIVTFTDRKFNRMRPSMERVLGLETRSAKEG